MESFSSSTPSVSCSSSRGAAPLTKGNLKELDKKTRGIISASQSGFEQACQERGIISAANSLPVENEDELRASIDAPRQLSPDMRNVEQFTTLIEDANERTIVDEMTPIFFERHDGTDYLRTLRDNFCNYPKELGFNNNLAPARPDWLEGPSKSTFQISSEELHSLYGYALPCDMGICFPHLTGEFSAPNSEEDSHEGARAAYTGACLVEARRQALAYMKRADPERHGAVLSFTTNGTLITFFAHHMVEQEGQGTEYHMAEICRTGLTDDAESFERARRQVRNMQDLGRRAAEDLRDDLIDFYRAKNGGRRRSKGSKGREEANEGSVGELEEGAKRQRRQKQGKRERRKRKRKERKPSA